MRKLAGSSRSTDHWDHRQWTILTASTSPPQQPMRLGPSLSFLKMRAGRPNRSSVGTMNGHSANSLRDRIGVSDRIAPRRAPRLVSVEIVVRSPQNHGYVDFQQRLSYRIGFVNPTHLHSPDAIFGRFVSASKTRVCEKLVPGSVA